MSPLGAALVLAALALASCGDSEDSTTSSTAQRTTTRQAGEKSVEGFGQEASQSERKKILASFEGYLDSLAKEDFASACERLSAEVKRSLEQFVPSNQLDGCAEILPKVLDPAAVPVVGRRVDGEATRVRLEDEQAFVIFRAPGAKLWVMPMVREAGEWRATTIAPSILVPEV